MRITSCLWRSIFYEKEKKEVYKMLLNPTQRNYELDEKGKSKSDNPEVALAEKK